ncbi:MAG: L,D-transpeptidase [Pseudonocardiales bacterium]|nr:MAG: L,D-transpeptidase [Pseudonocardiales bacterium]
MRRVLMLFVVAFLLAACSGSSPGPSGAGVAPRPQAQVNTLPGDKASNVSPTLPVSVRVIGGVLNQVALTNPDGRAIAGALSTDRQNWISSEALGYSKTYTWHGSAAGPDRLSVPVAGSFTTVKPKRQLHATLNIGDGDTVGVAAPIILQFDHHVSDKAAAERALQVQASVPAEGSWAWLPDDNGGSRAHYRPQDYWQPDTKVSVTAKLYGVALGDGSYGKEDISTRFKIGRSQIVRADVNSHHMVVIRDGQEVMNFPASYGLSSDPNRNTTSGIHVVMNKAQTVLMSNRAYGYVNIPEHWAVRISNNGEFIHANPETTGVQGSSNVTHGCVNLSTANAQEYFGTAIFGDPVEVTNSPTPLSGADGDIYDWTVPWESWLAMSALHS